MVINFLYFRMLERDSNVVFNVLYLISHLVYLKVNHTEDWNTYELTYMKPDFADPNKMVYVE